MTGQWTKPETASHIVREWLGCPVTSETHRSFRFHETILSLGEPGILRDLFSQQNAEKIQTDQKHDLKAIFFLAAYVFGD